MGGTNRRGDLARNLRVTAATGLIIIPKHGIEALRLG
jgi:hypothetical protein